MKNKGTLILLAVTVALALYVYLVEFDKPKKDEAQKSEQAKLLSLKQDQINRLAVQKQGQPAIVLTKSPDGWNLVEPLKDNADNGEVEEFLRALSEEKYTDVANANKDGQSDLKIYGFETPLGTIELQDQSGVKVKYTIGSRKNFEGNAFLQKAGDSRVLVVSNMWPARVEKRTLDFRDKRMLRASVAKIQKIQIRQLRRSVAMEQADNKWKIVGKDVGVDQNRAREVLTMLSESRATDILVDHDPENKQKLEYGLNQPDLTITATVDGQPWEAVLARGKDKSVYTWVKKPAFVMKLESAQLEKFKEVSISFLREKKKVFDFDKANVASVSFKEKSGKLKVADKSHPDFFKFIENVASFEVSEYVEGLSKPQFENTLEFKNDKGENIFTLMYGPAYANKDLFAERKFLFAQTIVAGKSSEVFLVDQAVASNVAGHDLFKEKPEAPGTANVSPAPSQKPEGHP